MASLEVEGHFHSFRQASLLAPEDAAPLVLLLDHDLVLQLLYLVPGLEELTYFALNQGNNPEVHDLTHRPL